MLISYFEKMRSLVRGYKEKYYWEKHRLVVLKLIVWRFIMRLVPGRVIVGGKSILKESRRIPSVAMITSGGMGDHLLFTNYLFHFMEKFNQDNIQTDVYFKDKFFLAPHLLRKDHICRNYYELKDLKPRKYDVVMDLAGFPQILWCDVQRVDKLAPKLSYYVELCNIYKKYFCADLRGNAYAMMRLCELEGRRLFQRGDIYRYLKIESFRYPVFIDVDEKEYLAKMKLNEIPYITIQTGCDNIYGKHVKQWPIEYYKTLVKMINKKYSHLKIVQVGNSGELCVGEIDTGVNLLNRTSVEQVKVLLKYSAIHIDVEGGLVHLRHALNGGISIVLFGPTPISFFGYEDNCNIVSEICKTPCYQLTSDWPQKCPKKESGVPCMEALTPAKVFSMFEIIYEQQNNSRSEYR